MMMRVEDNSSAETSSTWIVKAAFICLKNRQTRSFLFVQERLQKRDEVKGRGGSNILRMVVVKTPSWCVVE